MNNDVSSLPPASRLWTRWWWIGNAATESGITAQLTAFRDAGFGGVEISPIYGVTGAEESYVDYLSPLWIELLAHTCNEAERLDLGVDMIQGTGWPFGGPWVSDDDRARRLLLHTFTVQPAETYTLPIVHPKHETATFSAAIATSEDGQRLPINSPHWTPPTQQLWHLTVAYLAPTGQQVKRAAPGGAGNVFDHFDPDTLTHYLAPFVPAFAALKSQTDGKMLRCLFNDSWEVFGSNTTAHIWQAFESKRGYDLRLHLDALSGNSDPDHTRRVRSDYRQTINDLTLDFVQNWTKHANVQGARSRNQAHGSPGNLLDLYAAADIPETEMFGAWVLSLSDQKPLTQLPPDDTAEEQFLTSKLAASAGNIASKPLISAEAFTWLGEHFQTPLSHLRAEADLMFWAGINHLFCHGTPYSPPEVPFPGWLFYASTHIAPSNTFWKDIPALTAYIARCQSFLQQGVPDNDLLLYFPYYDLLDTEEGARDLLHFLTVHGAKNWQHTNLPAFFDTQQHLLKNGYLYDTVSDHLLTHALTLENGTLKTAAGSTYRSLLLTNVTTTQPETVARWIAFAQAGIRIGILGDAPRDVPGFHNYEARQAQLQDAVTRLLTLATVYHSNNLPDLLNELGLRREESTDHNIRLTRRRNSENSLYYLHNAGTEAINTTVPFAVPAQSGIWQDPQTGKTGTATITPTENGCKTFLYLPAKATLLLTLAPTPAETSTPYPFLIPSGDAIPLTQPWEITFLENGQTLPAPQTITELTSWTDWQGTNTDALQAFSGTARYRTIFDLPPNTPADRWLLTFTEIAHSATITLNGENIGILYANPLQIALPNPLPTGNILEIEVTNLMANRIIAMDKAGENWKNFFFVNIAYKTFNATAWKPLPSGLIGTVSLIPTQDQHSSH